MSSTRWSRFARRWRRSWRRSKARPGTVATASAMMMRRNAAILILPRHQAASRMEMIGLRMFNRRIMPLRSVWWWRGAARSRRQRTAAAWEWMCSRKSSIPSSSVFMSTTVQIRRHICRKNTTWSHWTTLLSTGKDSTTTRGKSLKTKTKTTTMPLNTTEFQLSSWREGCTSFSTRGTRSVSRSWKRRCGARRRGSSRKRWRRACGRTRRSSRCGKTMSRNEEIVELGYLL